MPFFRATGFRCSKYATPSPVAALSSLAPTQGRDDLEAYDGKQGIKRKRGGADKAAPPRFHIIENQPN